jgi:hypothetical protein
MKTIKHPLFLISVFLFIMNQIMERKGIFIPWVHAYLDDLLCMPVTLTIALFMQQKFTFSPSYTLSKNKIIGVLMFYSVFYEVWLPHIYSRYTSDVLDVAAYATGAVLFYFFLNNPGEKNKGISLNIPYRSVR